MIDISDTILYDEIKSMTEFLEVVNGCISHEVRNPLNSIIAQNISKKVLYKKLKQLIQTLFNHQI